GHADCDKIRIASQFVLVIEHDVDGHMAGEGELAAIPHSYFNIVAYHLAILVDSAERNALDQLYRSRCEAKHLAVTDLGNFRDAAHSAERAVGCQMGSFTVHWHQNLRPHPFIHPAHLIAAWMARHMDKRIRVFDDLDTL